MKKPLPPPLGDQEWDLLRFVSDHAPLSVRAVFEQWGTQHGLAKTTVQTMMERLRAKGYLTRAKGDGGFGYAPAVAKRDLLRGLVNDFVEKTLRGSFSPLVAYLAEKKNLTPDELALLQRFVDEEEEEAL